MNPREVLGVGSDASPADIKSAYRKLAMKHHPDKGGDPAEFQKIQEAYDALTKPKAAGPQPGGFTDEDHPFRRHGFAWAFRNGNGEFWGGPQQNTDFNVQAAISLEQAYTGCELSVTINDRVITIRVPAGVQHGQRLILEGEGGREFSELPAGNLNVIIMVRPHPQFQLGGRDLLTVKELDVLDMLTGCDLEVMTLMGDRLTVTVPPGSKPTTRLRIPGKGMPIQNSNEFGSLFVALNPLFPNMTPEQIEKLREVKNA